MKPAPQRLEVEITYRIPEPVMNGVVAGEGFWRYLPFEPEVTVQLPPLRGVREEDLVPAALVTTTCLRNSEPRSLAGLTTL